MKVFLVVFSLFFSLQSFSADTLDLEFRVDSSSIVLNSVDIIYKAAVSPNIFHALCREWRHDADDVFNGHWEAKTLTIKAKVNALGDNIYLVTDKLKDGGGFCKYTPLAINLEFNDFRNDYHNDVFSLWLPRADFDFDKFASQIKVERLIFTDDNYKRLDVTANADAINFSSIVDVSTETVQID